MGIALPCTHSAQYTNTSSGALQPGVGLGLLCKTPPNLSVPCSVSPFVYSHLSQVRGHVIQPSHFWSSSSSRCIQVSIQHLFLGIAVSCILSIYTNTKIKLLQRAISGFHCVENEIFVLLSCYEA